MSRSTEATQTRASAYADAHDTLARPELFVRWQRTRDAAAGDALVRRYMPLARRLARRYARSSEPYEDLAQVAGLALVKAIDRFDPERGTQFPAFATPTILGELRRHFRDCAWSVHVPRGAKELAAAIEDGAEQLRGDLGFSPTALQLSQYLEMELEVVLEGMSAAQAYETESLDAPHGEFDEGGSRTLGDMFGVDDERFELLDDDDAVVGALGSLTPRERDILHMRFMREMTQSEIAACVGISQMQISRVLRRSLTRLREEAGA